MDQRLSLVTLGVSDVARSRAFYEALGWTTGAGPEDDVVFFQCGGMVVALWDRARLAEDSGVTDPGGWGGITLAHNVGSPAEVDAVIEEVRAAGGTIVREPGRDLLGRLLGGLHRSGRSPVGGRPQPALDARARTGRSASSHRGDRLGHQVRRRTIAEPLLAQALPRPEVQRHGDQGVDALRPGAARAEAGREAVGELGEADVDGTAP